MNFDEKITVVKHTSEGISATLLKNQLLAGSTVMIANSPVIDVVGSPHRLESFRLDGAFFDEDVLESEVSAQLSAWINGNIKEPVFLWLYESITESMESGEVSRTRFLAIPKSKIADV